MPPQEKPKQQSGLGPNHHQSTRSPPGGRGSDARKAGMSVFGGDSWARDAQQRKRRLDDLLLPTTASSSPSTPDSFRKLPNGKLACLACPHRPVLDTPLMLSMHNKGARHIAAESRLREKDLSKKHEINKRPALSSDASHPNFGNPRTGVRPNNIKEKPLIEETRRAILEAQSSRFNDFKGKKVSHDSKRTTNTGSFDSNFAPSDVPMELSTGNTGSREWNCRGETFAGTQTPDKFSDRQTEVRKRQEQELRFTASGWKRDGHGRWYRDENVEFDSDEDDPNICLC